MWSWDSVVVPLKNSSNYSSHYAGREHTVIGQRAQAWNTHSARSHAHQKMTQPGRDSWWKHRCGGPLGFVPVQPVNHCWKRLQTTRSPQVSDRDIIFILAYHRHEFLLLCCLCILLHTPSSLPCHHAWLKLSLWLPEPSFMSLPRTILWFPNGVCGRGQCPP